MKALFDTCSHSINKCITNTYSTSFSIGIRLFHSHVRANIYAIYAFVRLADEIVDSFDSYDQKELLDHFKKDYQLALKHKISLNPVLNSFQDVVHRYNLYDEVDSFIRSMELDLEKNNYATQEEYENYIYGSADVVGLMCVKVFIEGDEDEFQKLKPYAMKLGSAFQKVNFLRDIKYDRETLGRSYFPNSEYSFSEEEKKEIINEIEDDFSEALIGIKMLPYSSKLGVYVAYKYYLNLLKKLKKKNAQEIISKRVRISNLHKLFILNKSYIRYKINVL